MPLSNLTGGIGQGSMNMIRQSSLENGVRQGTTSGTLDGGQATQVFNNTIISNGNLGEKSNDGTTPGGVSKKMSNKINMEAYQAYYNTNESCSGQNNPPAKQQPQQTEPPYNEVMIEGKDGEQNMKIINNITHISTQNVYQMNINHSGANINIMCGSGGGPTVSGGDESVATRSKDPNIIQQSNNFIFNHTAPINLNFYEEV
mmetsp:Transcript_7666/g.11875  ORF Transcript_7666/g.11875 Transcript_7666/m.11875 type:complete len:202 (-) Transcript_7666:138-743(-)